MKRLVFDSGGLIALERRNRALWADLASVALRKGEVIVPSTALAQAWRGGRSQALLARALRHCVIAPFDPLTAFSTGGSAFGLSYSSPGSGRTFFATGGGALFTGAATPL